MQEDTTDLLGLIQRLSLASQITAPFDLEKMAVPPGQLALSPYCDQRMRLRAVVLSPATHKILRGLQAGCRAPPGVDAMAG